LLLLRSDATERTAAGREASARELLDIGTQRRTLWEIPLEGGEL